MHAIVAIPLIIFTFFLIAIIYFWVKEDVQNKQLTDVISSINSRYRYIGKVLPETQIRNIAPRQNGALQLVDIKRLFKYENETDFTWIEYSFRNNTTENITFFIKTVSVKIDGTEIGCDLSLLLEFVPEYLAPPHGIKYFDIQSYNNYQLGTQGQQTFRFESRFPMQKRNNFNARDFIKIEVELYKLDDTIKKYVPFDTLIFTENFEKMVQKTIYAIDENIKWEH